MPANNTHGRLRNSPARAILRVSNGPQHTTTPQPRPYRSCQTRQSRSDTVTRVAANILLTSQHTSQHRYNQHFTHIPAHIAAPLQPTSYSHPSTHRSTVTTSI